MAIMATVSFQVIDGVDKGRWFEDLQTPVTVGREDGNVIRLNDDRVSRFHAKVQVDQDQIVLTDLDSTNGTSVNGEPTQLRILRPGDQVTMGRTKLVFGTPAQIAAFARGREKAPGKAKADAATIMCDGLEVGSPFDTSPIETQPDFTSRGFPRLPTKLMPAQAARFAEVIDFLHRALADAAENVQIQPIGGEVRLDFASWQRIQAVLAILARYSREVAEPAESSEPGTVEA
jgi:hypothetical protein